MGKTSAPREREDRAGRSSGQFTTVSTQHVCMYFDLYVYRSPFSCRELAQSKTEGDAKVVSLGDTLRQLSTAKVSCIHSPVTLMSVFYLQSGVESELELLKSQLADKTMELQSVMMVSIHQCITISLPPLTYTGGTASGRCQ